jgi:phosphoglycolate phosphatase/putative hydrolase of the HAD superfamily
MRALKAVLFDLDGTLYDARRLRRRIATRMLAALLRSPAEGIAAIRAIGGYRRAHEQLRGAAPPGDDLAAAQLARAAELAGMPEHAVQKHLGRWFEREAIAILREIGPAETRPMLQRLRDRGLRLAVVSDYPAVEKLHALGLEHCFDSVVSAQDAGVQRLKPDPGGLLAALGRIEVVPGEAIYVGDRMDVDGACARAAGVEFVLLARPGGRAHTKKISCLPDLEALLPLP